MKKTIAVLPGDGIGPEIISATLKVLSAVEEKFGHTFEKKEGLIGTVAVDRKMNALPDETIQLCFNSDAVLLGTVGDPRKYNDQLILTSLLDIRKKLGLFANIRPIFTYPSLYGKSPLKKEVIEGADFVIVRELTGGIYFGKPRERRDGGNTVVDTCVYTRYEIERITHVAFKIAHTRRNKVTMVDKSNVLETSKFWREIVTDIAAREYSDTELDFLLVDNAAMQILKRPRDFDVILTENMFGDILSDEASVITGSIGLLPSASIGEKASIYEPIHGSFPKAANLNVANPIGTILSGAMLLETSFGLIEEAKEIRRAVKKVLDEGFGTRDIVDKNPLGTLEIGNKIAEYI